MVPVLTQAPPRMSLHSMSATRLPKYAACAAPFSPAGPEPITIRSNASTWKFLPHDSCMRLIVVEPEYWWIIFLRRLSERSAKEYWVGLEFGDGSGFELRLGV